MCRGTAARLACALQPTESQALEEVIQQSWCEQSETSKVGWFLLSTLANSSIMDCLFMTLLVLRRMK